MRRLLVSLTGSALALSLAFARPAAAEPTRDAAPADARPSPGAAVQRYTVAGPGAPGSLRAGGAVVVVRATMAEVRKVALDYRHYAELLPIFDKVRVLGRGRDGMHLYLHATLLDGAVEPWAEVAFAQEKTAHGEATVGRYLQGNLDDVRLRVEYEPVDATHTAVRVELFAVPPLPVPKKLASDAMSIVAATILTLGRARVESR